MAVEITLSAGHHLLRSWSEVATGEAVPADHAEALLYEALRDPLCRSRLASLLGGLPLYRGADLDAQLASALASGEVVLERLPSRWPDPGTLPLEPSAGAALLEEAQEVRLGETASEEETEALDWVEIELLDEEGEPVPYELFELTLADGEVRRGNLDAQGVGRVTGIPAGTYELTFPRLYASEWSR